jgi:hypothetical protein
VVFTATKRWESQLFFNKFYGISQSLIQHRQRPLWTTPEFEMIRSIIFSPKELDLAKLLHA